MRSKIILLKLAFSGLYCLLSANSSFLLADSNIQDCDGKVLIDKILFESKLNLSDESLLRNLTVKEGQPCEILNVQKSAEVLKERGIFKIVSFSFVRKGKGLNIVFSLEALNVLSEVIITGNNFIDSKDIRREIGKRTGDNIVAEDIPEIKKRILTYYQASGYPEAEVEVSQIVERTYPLLSIKIKIHEKTPLRFKEVLFEGENLDKHRAILSDIKSFALSVIRDKSALRKIKHYAFLKFKEENYFKARIKESISGGKLIINITPRDRIYFKVEGNKAIPTNLIFDSLQLASRNIPLSDSSDRIVCGDLISEYSNFGYTQAKLECSWQDKFDDKNNYIGENLVIVINEGEKSLIPKDEDLNMEAELDLSITKDQKEIVDEALPKVSRILIVGNYFTQDKVIIRELGFKVGEHVTEEMLAKSRRAILSLGIFSNVEIKIAKANDLSKGYDVLVEVKEKEAGIVQGLVEVSTQDGIHLQSQVAQRNLSGTGRAIILGVDGYVREKLTNFDAARARLAFVSPKLFGSSLDYNLEGFYQTALNLNQTFKLDRVGVTQGLRYPLIDGLKINLSNSIYSERLFGVQPDIILGSRDVGNTNYSVIRSSFIYDRRDDPFVATKGYRVEFGGSYFPTQLGSEVDMIESHFQETTIIPVLDNLTYAFNVRGGFFKTLNSENVPLGSRYFLGGRDSLRGYTRFQVGPRSTSGSVVGGDTFLVFSQEFRRDLGQGILGILFFDYGQSFLRKDSDFSVDLKNHLKDFKFSPGIGLQYATPIGPVSAEVGFATNREFGERWGRFILSIGNAF